MTRDVVQRYKCRSCGHTFTAGQYKKTKYPRETVKRALKMVQTGYSYRSIASALSEWYDKSVTGASIANWTAKFGQELIPEKKKTLPSQSFLQTVNSNGKNAPILHLDDLPAKRRVNLDHRILDQVAPPRFSAYEWIYHIKFHRKNFSIHQCRRIAKRLGLNMEQLERQVTAIYSGKSGQSKPVRVRFPLKATKSHAFLIGLFYSSGGIGGSSLHFAVDKQVGEYLVTLATDIGEAPTNLTTGTKLRKAHGTHSFSYSIVMLDILKHFGLKATTQFLQLGKGKYVPSRGLTVKVPPWIHRSPAFMHSFVEGYVNGIRTSAGLAGRKDYRRNIPVSWSTDMHRVVYANVKISFSNYNHQELKALVNAVVKHLKAFGVNGWVSELRKDGRKMHHYSYGFHTLPSLAAFQDHFLMLRPMVQTKLHLRLNRDPLVVHILQKTRDLDNFVLGMVMKHPRTLDELVELCPRRPYNMTTSVLLTPSLTRLQRMGVLTEQNGVWRYDPALFARSEGLAYQQRVDAKDAMLKRLKGKPLYYCVECHDVGLTPICSTCGKPRARCTEYELRRLKDGKATHLARELLART